MRRFFQNIRKKPKSIRNNYAFAIAGSFTVVVMMIWVVSQPNDGIFTGGGKLSEEEKNSPFSTFIKESKEQMASLKGAFSDGVSNLEETNTPVATSSNGIMLNQDDLDIAKPKLEQSTTTSLEPVIYQEVMIGTTSDSRGTTSNAENTNSTSSAGSM
jgi:hypothetical protein